MKSAITVCTATLGSVFLSGASSVAASGQQWFLMARHGECMEIEKLRRKVPDLGGINDPYSFVKLMNQKGHAVTSTEITETKGKVVEVKVPAEGLSLIFVTSELCQESGAK